MQVEIDTRFELRPSKIHGIGCFTVKPLRGGQFITNYAGERITPTEARWRAKRQVNNRICHLNFNVAIDGSVGGNGSHYINHSCDPNCHLVFTEDEILIYALKTIQPDEELTVDYYFELYMEGRGCQCGVPECREDLQGLERITSTFSRFLKGLGRPLN